VWFKSSVIGVSRAIEKFCAEQYKKNAFKVDGVHLLEYARDCSFAGRERITICDQ